MASISVYCNKSSLPIAPLLPVVKFGHIYSIENFLTSGPFIPIELPEIYYNGTAQNEGNHHLR
jgi:hypothetical protein